MNKILHIPTGKIICSYHSYSEIENFYNDNTPMIVKTTIMPKYYWFLTLARNVGIIKFPLPPNYNISSVVEDYIYYTAWFKENTCLEEWEELK